MNRLKHSCILYQNRTIGMEIGRENKCNWKFFQKPLEIKALSCKNLTIDKVRDSQEA